MVACVRGTERRCIIHRYDQFAYGIVEVWAFKGRRDRVRGEKFIDANAVN